MRVLTLAAKTLVEPLLDGPEDAIERRGCRWMPQMFDQRPERLLELIDFGGIPIARPTQRSGPASHPKHLTRIQLTAECKA